MYVCVHVCVCVCVFVQDFAKADSRCPDYVRDGFSMIYDLAQRGLEGIVHVRVHSSTYCTYMYMYMYY